MKLVRGNRLDRWAPGQPLGERLRLFEKICEAVAFAHAHGVIHMDLKPANIMVGEFGEVLVMDWGIAKVAERADWAVGGTPGYMAPEQERGEGSAASDVYALGAILSFVVGPQGPKPLLAVAPRAMSAADHERYPIVQELSAEVVRHLAGERVLAYREGLVERAGRVLGRHRTAVVLVLAYVLMRLLLLWFLGR
jgi:serine/threonine-protein kinase